MICSKMKYEICIQPGEGKLIPVCSRLRFDGSEFDFSRNYIYRLSLRGAVNNIGLRFTDL